MSEGKADAADAEHVIARVVRRHQLAIEVDDGAGQKRADRGIVGVESDAVKARGLVVTGREAIAELALCRRKDVDGEAAGMPDEAERQRVAIDADGDQGRSE